MKTTTEFLKEKGIYPENFISSSAYEAVNAALQEYVQESTSAAEKRNDEQKALLKRSVNEIQSLRSHNRLMGARLDMFDSVMMLLRTHPAGQNGVAHSPDIVYEIERTLAADDNDLFS